MISCYRLSMDELVDIAQYYADLKRYQKALNVPRYDSDYQCRSDYAEVDKIIFNWERTARQLQGEWTVCRRSKKITGEYRRLAKLFREMQAEIEQAITMFTLLHG